MSSRKRRKKGSFRSHLDELVTVFGPEPAKQTGRPKEGTAPKGDVSVHDRLFESGRNAPEGRPAH